MQGRGRRQGRDAGRIARVAVALVAAVAVLGLATPGASTLPAVVPDAGPAASSVDFGVVGADALAEWTDAAFTYVGPPDAALTLHLYLGLVSDRDALEARALAVSDPRAPHYGVYAASVESAGATYNASDETVAAVVEWFAARGVTLHLDPTHSYLEGDVPVDVAAEAFEVEYGEYTADGLPDTYRFVTPVDPPTQLAPGLEGLVDRVYGAVRLIDTESGADVTAEALGQDPDDTRLGEHPVSVAAFPYHAGGGGTPWRTGTAIDACPDAASLEVADALMGLSPAQVRTAYGIDHLWDAGFRGQGARIAIVGDGLPDPDDVATFRACFGLEGTEVHYQVIGNPSGGPDDETTLDVQVVTSIAPEAERIDLFAVGTTSSAIELARFLFDMIVSALDVSRTGGVHPHVISVSYGMCEPDLQQTDPGFSPMADLLDQVLATVVVTGIGVFVASGDDGSSGCWPFLEYPDNMFAATNWTSTSRWVTAVGGTNLTLTDDNHILSSGVWNDLAFGLEPHPPVKSAGAGGGGISVVSARPPYQKGPGVPAGDTRLVPDVSAFADSLPGYLVFFDGAWTFIGGTSASTPLTAGAFALQTTLALSRGQPPLGFVNPLLYQLAETDSGGPTSPIFDITIGSNDEWDIGVYPAGPRYDLASGLGSVMHDALAAALAGPDTPPLPTFTG